MKKISKKILSFIIVLTLVTSGFINYNLYKNPVEVSAAKLNKKKVTLNVGDTYKLKVKGVSASASITWKTSNKKVCTVSSSGLITPKKKGKATVKAVIGGTTTLKCKVNVRSCFTISKSSKLIDVGSHRYSSYSSAYVNKYTYDWYLFRCYLEKLENLGGGTLVVKKGTYNIPTVLCIASNINIVFEKGAKINKTSSTHTGTFKASATLFELVPQSKYRTKNWAKKYNGVKNVKIIGKGKNVINMNYYSKGVAITIYHSKNISISGITFKNINEAHAIELDAGKNIEISNCKFKGQKGKNSQREAINLDVPDGKYAKVWAASDKTNNDGIVIKNCTFKKLYVGVGSHYYTYNSSTHKMIYHNNVLVENCTFINNKKYGVQAFNWANSTIKNCKFENIGGAHDGNICGIMGKGTQKLNAYDNSFKNIKDSSTETGFGIFVKDHQLSTENVPKTHPKFLKGSAEADIEYFEKHNTFENCGTNVSCVDKK